MPRSGATRSALSGPKRIRTSKGKYAGDPGLGGDSPVAQLPADESTTANLARIQTGFERIMHLALGRLEKKLSSESDEPTYRDLGYLLAVGTDKMRAISETRAMIEGNADPALVTLTKYSRQLGAAMEELNKRQQAKEDAMDITPPEES